MAKSATKLEAGGRAERRRVRRAVGYRPATAGLGLRESPVSRRLTKPARWTRRRRVRRLGDEALDKYPKIVRRAGLRYVLAGAKGRHDSTGFRRPRASLLLNILKVLASHDRSYILRSVREEFRKQYDKAKGITPVRVVTAVPLPESRPRLLPTASFRHRGQPILQPEVDPSLIGGVVVQIGDVVFDGSLSSSLARLREKLITRSVHEIQRRRDSVSTTAGN